VERKSDLQRIFAQFSDVTKLLQVIFREKGAFPPATKNNRREKVKMK
jgi:hypothetical protein